MQTFFRLNEIYRFYVEINFVLEAIGLDAHKRTQFMLIIRFLLES